MKNKDSGNNTQLQKFPSCESIFPVRTDYTKSTTADYMNLLDLLTQPIKEGTVTGNPFHFLESTPVSNPSHIKKEKKESPKTQQLDK